MGNHESARIQEIDRRLEVASALGKKVDKIWLEVSIQRIKLESEVKSLIEERDTLSQGQLMFMTA